MRTDDKLLLKAIRREAVPRRPLWIMRQAGRYLPEYREFRAKHSFKELAGDAELAAEVTLMPLKRYPLDAAIVFADIMSPMPSLGIEFDFDPGPVVANPIRDAAAIERLRDARSRRDRARGDPGAEAHARGAAERAPRCSASAARRGRSRPISSKAKARRTFRRCARSPRRSRSCSTRCSRGSRASWPSTCSRQAAAGADAVQIFDSWAGLLSRASWERLIRPHLQSLLEAVGKAGVPRILFLQNAPHLMDAYASLPAEVLGVDWRIDLPELAKRYPQRAVQGNLEPAILTAGAEATRAAAKELLARRPRRAATS